MSLKEKDLITSYVEWLKSKITSKAVNDYYEISTPFLDRHNDHLQIYVKQEGDKIILTDDGYTVNDLVLSGCDVRSPRRQSVMLSILNGLGVNLNSDALVVEARPDNYPQKKHALLQAMLSVNDMFMLSTHKVASIFLEDVEAFLDKNEIRYTPTVQFTGKSGFSHTFDFVIPSSKSQPERLIKAINTPTKDKAKLMLFTWGDIRQSRKHESSMFVFLNNLDKKIKPEIVSAFTEYDIKPILWTQRQDYIDELSA